MHENFIYKRFDFIFLICIKYIFIHSWKDMTQANIIYDTVLWVTWQTRDVIFNQHIFDVFCKVVEDNTYINYGIQRRIERYIFDMERNDDTTKQIFDNLYDRLHKVKDNKLIVNSELTKSIKDAIENNDISRHKIMRLTHNPEYQFDEIDIWFYSHPQTISYYLKKLWLYNREIKKKNSYPRIENTKVTYKLQWYIIDDLESNEKYKLFDIGDKDIEPRLFFLAIDKKDKRKITYHAYDPDEENYKKTIKDLLQENFLFSLRSDG